jgi:hypothetical protein
MTRPLHADDRRAVDRAIDGGGDDATGRDGGSAAEFERRMSVTSSATGLGLKRVAEFQRHRADDLAAASVSIAPCLLPMPPSRRILFRRGLSSWSV